MRPRRPLFSLLVLIALAAAVASACSDGTASAPETPGALRGSITVFAASSLGDAFTELGQAFEDAHPGTNVRFNFAASSALALQINEGAPADVFASADEAQMRAVVEEGQAMSPRVFARNAPVVVVPSDTDGVQSFEDLAKPGLKLVLAAPDVPIGRYAREILANATGTDGISADFSERVLANLVSNEPNVRSVLTKVQLGEADAGIVYRTDAAVAADDVLVVEIPSQYTVTAEYWISTIAASDNPALAGVFVEYVLSPDGQAILRDQGFEAP